MISQLINVSDDNTLRKFEACTFYDQVFTEYCSAGSVKNNSD